VTRSGPSSNGASENSGRHSYGVRWQSEAPTPLWAERSDGEPLLA